MVSTIVEIAADEIGLKNPKLPPCIGFGVLDDSRTRIEFSHDKDGEASLVVSYRSYEGELVYKVRLEKESCYVEEFFEGRVIGGTRSTTLERAFNRHFLWWASNPRFRDMIDRITAEKNVALVRPGRHGLRSVYFPEGLIFILRLPVVPYDRMKEVEPKLLKVRSHVFLEGIYGGEFITAGQGRLTHYFSYFVDFRANMWHLEETVDFLFRGGLIPQYPQMGLSLTPQMQPPVPAKSTPGKRGQRWRHIHTCLIARETYLLQRPRQ